jgi:hypothetical protein
MKTPNIQPGELWMLPYGNAGATRQALVLNVFGGGEYVLYLLVHPLKKDKENVRITAVSGEMWVDPRKVSFDHVSKFSGYSKSIPAENLHYIRSISAKAIGVDPNAPSDTEQRLKSALASIDGMKSKIEEYQHQLSVYKELCERGLLALLERLCPEKSENNVEKEVQNDNKKSNEKTLTQLEQNRLKYAKVQKYIAVKCKEVGMSLSTLDRLTGHVTKSGPTGAISHWAKGDSKANWFELERIFPGLKAEAEAWAENQEKTDN